MAPTAREPLTGEIAATLQDRPSFFSTMLAAVKPFHVKPPSHRLLTDVSPTLRIVAQVDGSLLGKLKGPSRLSRKLPPRLPRPATPSHVELINPIDPRSRVLAWPDM